MTSSWNITRESKQYQEALAAVKDISADRNPKAFVAPDAESSDKLGTVIKQNNFLIQLIVTQSRQIEDLSLQLVALRREVASIQGKAQTKVDLPEEVIADLTSRFEGLKVEKAKKKNKAPFQSFPIPGSAESNKPRR
uniref:P2 n=1 Tax=Chestnut mosaic virus TaxID=2781948 RepID=A0A7M4CJX2_9VIRU|nr:hypothetical protein [Chestnut mosaic virus]